jgi:aspartokinase
LHIICVNLSLDLISGELQRYTRLHIYAVEVSLYCIYFYKFLGSDIVAIVVQKYGGSSVSTVEKIKNIAKTVINRKKAGNSMIIVVSAMGDTTDELIDLANKVTDTPDKRELDALLSTGEMKSAALLAMAIKSFGFDAISYTAYQIGIKN